MTRAFRMFGVAVALGVSAAMAGAQTSRAVTIGFSAGASMPSGDFGRAFDMGFALAGHAYYKPASMKGNLGFRGDINFERWKHKTVDASARVTGVMFNGLYDIGSKNMSLRPYVLAGVGLQNLQTSFPSTNGTGTAASTKIGFQGGGGVTFFLAGFSTFIEARYVNRLKEGSGSSSTTWIPIIFGVHF